MKHTFNIFISILSTILVYCLGGWDITLQLFTLTVVLDYISGVCRALYIHNFDSNLGIKGIIKKVGYYIIITVAVVLDKILANTGSIRTVVIYFFIANEGLSIIDNWTAVGLPLPKKITKLLEQLKTDNEREDKKDE